MRDAPAVPQPVLPDGLSVARARAEVRLLYSAPPRLCACLDDTPHQDLINVIAGSSSFNSVEIWRCAEILERRLIAAGVQFKRQCCREAAHA